MKPRLWWMLWMAVLLAASPAAGQTTQGGGSLTVLSRPSGAAFRLAGAQVVVGRTPMTIDRGFTGRYEVSCVDPVYGGWHRTLFLSGTTADTVWMTLSPRGAAGAGLRSLLIPGWGQFYGRHRGRGVLFLGAAVTAGAGLAVAAIRYQDRVDTYRAADARYQAAGTPTEIEGAFQARQRASSDAEDAFQLRQIAFGVLCGVWGLNVIEAVVHFPSLPSDRMSLSVVPSDPGLRGGPMATLTVRF